jgi:hypothetical protein
LVEQYGVPKRFIEVLDKTKRWALQKSGCLKYFVAMLRMFCLDSENVMHFCTFGYLF